MFAPTKHTLYQLGFLYSLDSWVLELLYKGRSFLSPTPRGDGEGVPQPVRLGVDGVQ